MKSERIKTNCSYCGNELYLTPYIMGEYKNHFCNRECSTKWKNELMPKGKDWHSYNRVDVICDGCGKSFSKNQSSFKNSKRHFCSKSCFDNSASRLGIRRGENSGSYKGGAVKFLCHYCKKETEVNRSRYNGAEKKGDNHYCSKECSNKWRSENIRGENNPVFGIKWDEERKEKYRKDRIGTYKYGSENPNWRGGNGIYPEEFSVILKRKIRKRYHFVCQCCGKNGYDVHHIDYDKTNNSDDNLICLCKSCHASTNGNRHFWMSHFKYLMSEKQTA